MSNGKSIPKKSSKPGSRTATSTTPPSGPIYVPSTAPSIEDWLTSLREDSPASPIVSQGNVKVKQTSETSGLIPRESSMRWDRDMSCWRTSQASFLEMQDGLPMGARLSESFPSWGTTVNGELWVQEMPAHPTSENDGGALGWPTPSANKIEGYSREDFSPTLNQVVQAAWATPQSRDYRSAEGNDPRWENPDRSRNLNDQVRTEGDMWMTPNTMDTLPAKTQEALDHEYTHRPGTKNPNNLRDQVNVEEGQATWPTPATMDHIERKGMRPSRAATNRQTGYLSEAIGSWATPTATQYKGWSENHNRANTNDRLDYQAERPATQPGPQDHQTETVGQGSSPSDPTSPQPSPRRLNPNFVEWLMGLPIGWTDLKPLETASVRQWYENFSQGSDA